MRLFGIDNKGEFKEFVEMSFQTNHRESVLEEWLESNPEGIVEDGKLLIIGRQVNTNLGSTIDLLAIDRRGDLVVLELKRDRTPRDTLAQSLEYASFVEQLNFEQIEEILCAYTNDDSVSLADYHRQYFELGSDDAVAFNKDQRIVIVGQKITNEIRQTSSFLRAKGIRVTCVEFSFFKENGGKKLLSQEIVVGKEPAKPVRISSSPLPAISENDFTKSLDKNGQHVFKKLLDFATINSFPIHWGVKGFSLNEDLNGNHVSICFGYPLNSVYKQSIYTGLWKIGGIFNKTNVQEEIVQSLYVDAQETGLFLPAGKELKFLINRNVTEKEIDSLLSWLKKVADLIKESGLKK